MNDDRFDRRLLARASAAAVSFSPDQVAQLRTYYGLLAKWNKTINLTALPLEDFPDRTLDRLFIEPALAASFVPARANWWDLGSGGGSPAVPLKVLRPATSLTMVEVRARKAAFLREVVRTLELGDATVVADPFRRVAMSPDSHGLADVVTARAVRLDDEFYDLTGRLLKPQGAVLVFAASSLEPSLEHGSMQITDKARLTGGDMLFRLVRR